VPPGHGSPAQPATPCRWAVEAPEGFVYVPATITQQRLTLIGRDQLPDAVESAFASGAYASTLTITLDDGTVLRDDDARDWVQRISDDRA
jgi:uncharacterized membrane-anchored protein